MYKGERQMSAVSGEPNGRISFEIEIDSVAPEKIAQKTCKNS